MAIFSNNRDSCTIVLTTPSDDGGLDQVLSTVDDGHQLLITLSVYLCVQHDWRLRVTASRGPSASVNSQFFFKFECFILIFMPGIWYLCMFAAVENVSLNKNRDLLQEGIHAIHRKVSNFNSTL